MLYTEPGSLVLSKQIPWFWQSCWSKQYSFVFERSRIQVSPGDLLSRLDDSVVIISASRKMPKYEIIHTAYSLQVTYRPNIPHSIKVTYRLTFHILTRSAIALHSIFYPGHLSPLHSTFYPGHLSSYIQHSIQLTYLLTVYILSRLLIALHSTFYTGDLSPLRSTFYPGHLSLYNPHSIQVTYRLTFHILFRWLIALHSTLYPGHLPPYIQHSIQVTYCLTVHILSRSLIALHFTFYPSDLSPYIPHSIQVTYRPNIPHYLSLTHSWQKSCVLICTNLMSVRLVRSQWILMNIGSRYSDWLRAERSRRRV
jgi:hypothetical protein